jgi:hypothetical protein
VSAPLKKLFPHRTDGVVNPLWPWVAGWLVEKDHTLSGDGEVTEQDAALFDRGRWFHLGWTLAAVMVLGVACARVFSLPAALNAVLLVGFGALLPRSAYFQPEPLFFALFLLTWLACLWALHRNSPWMHLVIGVVGGLAYLAKGSVEPLLMAYAGISTLRWLWAHALGWRGAADAGTTLWSRREHWMGLFILLFSYLMTTGPRMCESDRLFGDPRHSFPAYWMWFDSWDDGSCYQWMGEHNTPAELATLTPETRPSFSKYMREHTAEQAIQRLKTGTVAKVEELLWPGKTPPPSKDGTRKAWKGVLELRGIYLAAVLALPALLLLWLAVTRKRVEHDQQKLHPEWWTMSLFVLGLVVGYSLLYGWYHPIGRGDRFMLSLYGPLALSLIWAAEHMLRVASRRNAPLWLWHSYHAAQWLLFAMICWRLVEVLRWPYFRA